VKDIVLFLTTVFAFALLVTAHCAIVFGLFRRSRPWRAPVALAIAPLAPFWALRERMWFRACVWTAGATVYVVAMLVQRF
jgi:hypothetical protein